MKKVESRSVVIRSLKFKIVLLITLMSLGAQAGRDEDKCRCQLTVGGEKRDIRNTHFIDLNECQEFINENTLRIETWADVCSSGEVLADEELTLSCGAKKTQIKSLCFQKTPYHNFTFIGKEAPTSEVQSIDEVTQLIGNKSSVLGDLQKVQNAFNLRERFSYIALFMERNTGLTMANVLNGGIYDTKSGLRIDLTILDFLVQIKEKLQETNLMAIHTQLLLIENGDPIKNFPQIFAYLDEQFKSRNVQRKLRNLYVQPYLSNGVALPVNFGLLTTQRITNPGYMNDLELYNIITLGKNRRAIFSQIHSELLPQSGYPMTLAQLRLLKEKKVEEIFKKVNLSEHHLRVNTIKTKDEWENYQFYIVEKTGATVLGIENAGKDPNNLITKEVVEVYNYIQTQLDENFMRQLLKKSFDEDIDLGNITPREVAENFDLWEDIVQEHSWERQIDAENDTILLIFRDWMKQNQEEIKAKLSQIEMHPILQEQVQKWRDGWKPKRALAINIYDTINELYPDRPWEKHFLLNEQGEKLVLGEDGFKRGLRTTITRVKSILKIENVASTAAGIGAMSTTGNPYASAATSTFVHDTIAALRYGHNVGEYILDNTPLNLASALLFSSGFAQGRMADAIFRGSANGALQAMMTGSDIKLGLIVGGVTGGVMQSLPAQYSNWVIPGENQDTLNVFSELAEQTFFKGVQGAIVGYLDDGNWKKGLKKGAIYGASTAAIKILVFGVRYDANAYISDEEIEEYNHLHNNECGHYVGEYLERDTSVMADRYGQELTINRDDVRRANIRKGGLINGSMDKNTTATNYSSPFFSEISMTDAALDREETILHEVMHTRQMQLGRLNNILNRLGPNKVPEGFWEEYMHIGNSNLTLPKGFYKSFIYIDLTNDIYLQPIGAFEKM